MNNGFLSAHKVEPGSPCNHGFSSPKKSLAPVLFQMPNLHISKANIGPTGADPGFETDNSDCVSAPVVPLIGNVGTTPSETNKSIPNQPSEVQLDNEPQEHKNSPGQFFAIEKVDAPDHSSADTMKPVPLNTGDTWWQNAKSLLTIVAGVLLVLLFHSLLTSGNDEPQLTTDASSRWSQENQESMPLVQKPDSEDSAHVDLQTPGLSTDDFQPPRMVSREVVTQGTAPVGTTRDTTASVGLPATSAVATDMPTAGASRTTRPLEPVANDEPYEQFQAPQMASRVRETDSDGKDNIPAQRDPSAQASVEQNTGRPDMPLQPPANVNSSGGVDTPVYPHTDPSTYKLPPGYFPLRAEQAAAFLEGPEPYTNDGQSPLPSAAQWDRTTNPNQF